MIRGEKVWNVGTDRSKLVERAIFALRGFGEFEARSAVGAYGKDLNDRIGETVGIWGGEVPASGVWCLIACRMAFGLSTFKIGPYRKKSEITKL